MPLENMQGDIEGLALYAGQSVGLVKDIKPAATIVRELKRETEQVFENWKLPTWVNPAIRLVPDRPLSRLDAQIFSSIFKT